MNMSFDLSGKWALVTGGRGLALGMAKGLADAGASVVLMSRSTPETDDYPLTEGEEDYPSYYADGEDDYPVVYPEEDYPVLIPSASDPLVSVLSASECLCWSESDPPVSA